MLGPSSPHSVRPQQDRGGTASVSGVGAPDRQRTYHLRSTTRTSPTMIPQFIDLGQHLDLAVELRGIEPLTYSVLQARVS